MVHGTAVGVCGVREGAKVWLLPLLLFAFAFGALIIAAQTSALSMIPRSESGPVG